MSRAPSGARARTASPNQRSTGLGPRGPLPPAPSQRSGQADASTSEARGERVPAQLQPGPGAAQGPAPNEAFGAPGIPPRWTRGAKDAVGTAYSAASRLWYTLAQGTVTEVYYPTVDRPQIRDLQFLLTDGASFAHRERKDCDARTEPIDEVALGYRITTSDRQGRYKLHKELIGDPHLSCLLLRTRVEVKPDLARALRLFVLCAPHLGGGGAHNYATVVERMGRRILLAQRDGVWLALGASSPFAYASVGYVGHSDGWSDIGTHFSPQWQFNSARDGNVALTGEVPLRANGKLQPEFTLGLAFGDSEQSALNTLLQSLARPFDESRERFIEQWQRSASHRDQLTAQSSDGGALYRRSVSVLLAHEDKSYPGALIASLSIPWGEVKGDDDLGGYHLVWTRDLVNSATGLLASGDVRTAERALVYLAAAQRPDGGFAQNFWINGTPYWQGIQLDEVAFPILLAWRLRHHGGSTRFDPYPMVARAAAFLMNNGPATQEERWEEAGGYSPSSLAVQIAGLVCAAELAGEHGDQDLARLALDYADFLESHLEAWTVTTQGALLPGVPRHYIRINPAPMVGVGADEDPNSSILRLANRPPGEPIEFPARDIVDAGFLELVRYGIRPPGDPLIEDSLRVVDAVLKVQTPFGPCWRRYNHDGYGQHPDGSAYNGWGRGGAWPLLTGERGHYELACGRDVASYVQAMERLANHLHMLPEQVWDLPDLPAGFLRFGRASGSAMPLMWAHAEYIRLLRSRASGVPFSLIPAVAARYRGARPQGRRDLEIWSWRRQVARVKPGSTLRVHLPTAFYLHFSRDDWHTVEELRSSLTPCGFEYVDVPLPNPAPVPLRFTFRYVAEGNWQGQDFAVTVK